MSGNGIPGDGTFLPVAARANGRAGYLAQWPDSLMPIAVFFDRVNSTGGLITANDSVDFWHAVALMEESLGRDVFRVADSSGQSALRTGLYRGAIAITKRDLDEERGGYAGVGGAEFACTPFVGSCPPPVIPLHAGIVGLSSSRGQQNFRSVQVVQHELMHAMGFGHTCYWSSVMAAYAASDARNADCLRVMNTEISNQLGMTPSDVAYYEAVREMTNAVRLVTDPLWLPETVAGERQLLMPAIRAADARSAVPSASIAGCWR